MILELDCGNSLIKWRVIANLQEKVLRAGFAEDTDSLLKQLAAPAEGVITAVRLVSVRSDAETSLLVERLACLFGVEVLCAQAAKELAGVENGYKDYQRLGLDRWLAVIGAYHLSRGACLVLDLGTAVTADLVDEQGRHLGGYICPGLPLMRNQLRTHTRRIRYGDDEAVQALKTLLPGRETVEAVERGCVLMLQGFASAQLLQAKALLGEDVKVYVTGGDASLVVEVLPQAQLVSDLVFVGLAQACPVAGG